MRNGTPHAAMIPNNIGNDAVHLPPPKVGLWKLILEISLHGWVSEGTLILLYATKIAEMNDSDQ